MSKQAAKKPTKNKPKKPASARARVIAQNRKARHDYEIIETFEAGLALEGWEVKSLRAGRGQLKESYVIIRHQEAFIIGAHMMPLTSASTHINPDPTRRRKLLLHRKQLDKLIGAVETKGMTLVALNLHWRGSNIKLEVALVRGKKSHDKRSSEKDRDWQRQKMRIMSSANKGR